MKKKKKKCAALKYSKMAYLNVILSFTLYFILFCVSIILLQKIPFLGTNEYEYEWMKVQPISELCLNISTRLKVHLIAFIFS